MKKIKLTSNIVNDEYTQYVYDKFDIQDSEKTVVDIEYQLDDLSKFDWNVGVIYGSSGSGKTTILKDLGVLTPLSFDSNKALISNFDWLEPKDATTLLSSMGLSSVPTWLRPFHLLSNGEQYRAELAYKVAKAKEGEIILIDEYTSVVDREVAKAMSFSLQKYIRKTNKKIVVASCHYDIMEWLMPDWTCSPQKGGALERCDYLRQGRPKIELQVSRVEAETWNLFKKHHYLTEDVNKTCKFFLFEWNGKPVGINAVITQPNGNFKKGVRGSRVVVLPDYQGLGFGSAITNFCASIFKNEGYRYFTKTIHPAIGNYRNNNPNIWKPTSKNGVKRNDRDVNSAMHHNQKTRLSYCHEYIGEPTKGCEELLLPINEMRLKDKIKRMGLF